MLAHHIRYNASVTTFRLSKSFVASRSRAANHVMEKLADATASMELAKGHDECRSSQHDLGGVVHVPWRSPDFTLGHVRRGSGSCGRITYNLGLKTRLRPSDSPSGLDNDSTGSTLEIRKRAALSPGVRGRVMWLTRLISTQLHKLDREKSA